jgi:hypothetical protein
MEGHDRQEGGTLAHAFGGFRARALLGADWRALPAPKHIVVK